MQSVLHYAFCLYADGGVYQRALCHDSRKQCCKSRIYLWTCLYRVGVSFVFPSAPPLQEKKIQKNGADYHWRSVSWGGSGFAFCRSSGTLSDKLCRSPAADRSYQRMRVLQYGHVFCRKPVYGTIDRHGYGSGDPVTVCGTEFNTAVCHLYYQHYFECCVCHVFCHNSAEGLDSGKSFALFVGRQKRFQKNAASDRCRSAYEPCSRNDRQRTDGL